MFVPSSLLRVCLLATCLLASASARAQSCHAPALRDMTEQHVRLELRGHAARYEAALYEGRYQGGALGLTFAQRWVTVEASLAYHRLERNGLVEHGPGHLLTAIRVPALSKERAQLRVKFGPELGAMFPTGAAAAGLGMGHVMLMPGLFTELSFARLRVVAQLGYGRALTHAGGHHHGGGQGALVNPMNASELEHGLALSVAATPWLLPSLRLVGAMPVADAEGRAREVLAPGVRFVLGAFDLGYEHELGLVGDPFVHRATVSLGAQW